MGLGDIFGGILVIIFGYLIATWPPLTDLLLTFTIPLIVFVLGVFVIFVGIVILAIGIVEP